MEIAFPIDTVEIYFNLTTGMDSFKMSFSDFLELPLLWYYQLLNIHANHVRSLENSKSK